MRSLVVASACLCAGTAVAASQGVPAERRTTSVVLDAVVVGKDGHPARGLRKADFDVREDGESVAIDGVEEIAAVGLETDRVGRSLVLLLDDSQLRAISTPVVQGIARMFLAHARPSVYYVDPTPLNNRGFDLGGGLVDHTGGTAFVESNTFDRAVDAIWDEAGHYYLIGYRPTGRRRALHDIRLKVRRRDLHVHARLTRGD